MTQALAEELVALGTSGLRRTVHAVQQRRAGTVLLHGERMADFASNDYLGLAADHRVARAASAVLQAEGTGAAASRLISGHHPVHEALERAIATLKGTERALTFPSGYMANIGAIPALVDRKDAIYSDQLNHASLIDGCRLSNATLRIFPHRDLGALEVMLRADAGKFRRSLIVVEGVFSMDGGLFPLDMLVPLAERFGAWTYVDDAHGTGVLGATGAGTAEHFGVGKRIDVLMGTLSKAIGTSGAYIAGSSELVEYLTSRARSFIFTTAAPPALAAASLEALRIAEVEPWRRARLQERAVQLRDRLRAAGRDAVGETNGHIVPVIVGDTVLTMALVADLRRRGFLVAGVRPPTVPQGTSRLRISLSALHAPELVDTLAAALIEAMRGVVP